MISKALRQGPFQAVDLPDTEGAQTRYNIQPSVLFVLLNEAPHSQGYQATITPLEGGPHLVSAGHFNYPLAKALHENAVRIPRYLVSAALKNQPPWLTAHMTDAVLAVRSDTSTLLEIIGGEHLSYHLHYHPEQGIHYEKITHRPTASSDEDDSWF